MKPSERFAEILEINSRPINEHQPYDQFFWLQKVLGKYFDQIIPELEKKIEESFKIRPSDVEYANMLSKLEKKIEELTRQIKQNQDDALSAFYSLSDNINHAFDEAELVEKRLNLRIERGELRCCPNCHTVVENTIKIAQLKYPELSNIVPHNRYYVFVECCKHCIEKPKEEQAYKDPQLTIKNNTDATITVTAPISQTVNMPKAKCDNCGKEIGAIAITRAGYQPHEVYCTEKCLQEKTSKVGKKIIKELNQECERELIATLNGKDNCIEIPNSKNIPLGEKITIVNTGANPINIFEKPECEHAWVVGGSPSASYPSPYALNRKCIKCGKVQIAKIEWGDMK